MKARPRLYCDDCDCLITDLDQAELAWGWNDEERTRAQAEGHKPGVVLGLDELCSGANIFFAATGITSGDLLKGVRYDEFYAYTQSMVLRSASGTTGAWSWFGTRLSPMRTWSPKMRSRVRGASPSTELIFG